ncbi:MAG: DNA-binding response regulator [Candidatus Eremiobacteraeota bacterium]|nr:DNA-binding response regulator [Candidatus Eremiobacteraeota bacterium]
MADSAGWARGKPSLELAGDGRWDQRLVATLRLDFDVRTSFADGRPQAIVLFGTAATYRGELADVRRRSGAPLVLVLDRADVTQRVTALEEGADDVLGEPYELCELQARLRAVVRRAVRPVPPMLRVADLELDLQAGGVRRAGRSIVLTRTEFALLASLARHQGEVVPHEMLAQEVWGSPAGVTSTTLHTFMSYLRGKIEEPTRARLLRTVRGIGYTLAGG